MNKKQKKYYFEVLTTKEAAALMKIRLHMVQVSENYRGKEQQQLQQCPMCTKQTDTTEHMFECKALEKLRKVWNTKFLHIKSNEKSKLINAIKFIESCEKVRPKLW